MNKCTIKPEAFSQFLLEILWLGLRILKKGVWKSLLLFEKVFNLFAIVTKCNFYRLDK